jgi:hypothetical protein
MRKLFFFKGRRGYQEHPVPEDLTDFIVVEVPEDFIWQGEQATEDGRLFLPDVSARESAALIDSKRQTAYKAEVDPLIAEATIKRALGLEAEADKLIASAVTKRLEIQQLYPKTTEELA